MSKNLLRYHVVGLLTVLLFVWRPSRAMVPLEGALASCRQAFSDSGSWITDFIPREAQFVKPEQSHNLDQLLTRTVAAGRLLERELRRRPIYSFTGEKTLRQTQWPTAALSEFRNLTGWQLPFGVSYDPTTQLTRFVAIGDPSLIARIHLRLSGKNNHHRQPIPLTHHPELNDGLAWIAEVPGDLQGFYYRFDYTAQPGGRSDFGEEIPAHFMAPDPTSLWSSERSSRVYFPPQISTNPTTTRGEPTFANPEPRRRSVILEIALRDLNPPEISQIEQLITLSAGQAQTFSELIKDFDGVEFLPVRQYAQSEIFPARPGGPRDTLYIHYWGYMPTGMGIALDLGGPDALIAILRHLRETGQGAIKDEVLQHTANKPPGPYPALNVFHFAMRKAYRPRECEITGCGNTTNLEWGNPFTKLMMQMIIQDLLIVGWQGHRYDLMGAIPRDTAQELVNLARRHKKHVTGEPYAYPYHSSFWNTEHQPLRDASVWDHHYRHGMRRAISEQQPLRELTQYLAGGSFTRWPDQSWDRTAILETHDGQTLTHYFAGNLDMALYATALQLMSLGDVTLAVSQVYGVNHGHLDNTPLDLARLTPQQKEHGRKLGEWIQIAKQFKAFFSHQFWNEYDPQSYVEFSDLNRNFGYIWLKKPAYRDVNLPDRQQLLILINNSQFVQTIDLPAGDWRVLQTLSSNLKEETYADRINALPFTVSLMMRQ